MKRAAALSLLLAIVACDALNGPATGVEYRGEPLAVVTGRMTAERNITLLGDLRLAIGWFTSAAVSAKQPDAVLTESVVYEPVFPAGFSVNLYELPEARGTVTGPSNVAGSAVGILFAYDDRNRNGLLDTFRGGQAPVDVVLGSSLGQLTGTTPNGYLVVFVQDPNQPGMPPTLKRGLNLVKANGDVVGFETVVPVHLDGDPLHNLYICEDLVTPDGGSACFDSVFPRSDGGVDGGDVDAGLLVRVSGSVGYTSGQSAIDVTVQAGSAATTDASVTVNGVTVPYNAGLGRYSLGASPGPVVAGADNALRVVVNGAEPLAMNVYVAGDFTVTAPAFNSSVDSGQPFTVSWTESKDAGSYRVTVYRSNPFSSIHDQRDIAALNYTVPPLSYEGTATLNVQASLPDLNGANGSFIYRYTSRSIPLTFQ